MRLTAMILLGTALHVAAKTTGQTVNFSGHDVPLSKVFQVIEQQTGYVVFYDQSVMEDARPVSITVNDFPLTDFLNEVLEGQSLGYSIKKKTIVIKRVTPRLTTNGARAASGTGPVKGRVVNEKGEPVEGVSVTVKGSNIGTSTNANGEFFLDNIDDDATLVFTHTSIEKTEQKRDGRGELTVGVKVRSSILDEVQVIPYGTQTKRFSVGNVTTVKGEDIAKQPVSNPLLALAGRVPGLFVTQQTGVPGGAVKVRVQGQNSIANGNEPLYIIDGVPYPSSMPAVGSEFVISGGNPLNFVNVADIESIEVLKDADATAIYGSRAANGAILITTKKGKGGQPNLDVNIQQGWGEVTRNIEMLSTRQYLDMRYEAYANDSIDWTDPAVSANDLKFWDTTRYTDWQKALIGGKAKYSKMDIALSGGNSLSQYIISSTYRAETTVFPGDFSDRKGSVHFNSNSKSTNEKFQLQLGANYMFDNNNLPVKDLTFQAVLFEPNAPNVYNADGSLNWALNPAGVATWQNPLVYQLYSTYSNKTNNLVSNAAISYTLLPGLTIKSSAGYTNMQTRTFSPTPLEAIPPHLRSSEPRTATHGSRSMSSWIVEPHLIYSKILRTTSVEAIVGSSIQRSNNYSETLNGSGYSSDLLLSDIKSATDVRIESSQTEYRYNAVFGRLNIKLVNKYLLNFAARRDGSSRFGEKNRFHNFWSLGTAWTFTEEPFVKNAISLISFGKLRSSYGVSGNDQIPDYRYLGLYDRAGFDLLPYQNTVGLVNVILPNPYLQWERTKKLQVGIDLGFCKSNVVLSGTYSDNRSSNQLLEYSLPSITGFNFITSNFPATVKNTSWEFTLNTDNVRKTSFSWASNLNFTIPRNKLVAFQNIEESSYANGSNGVIVGQPVGVRKVYHFLGVDPTTGLYIVADSEGKPTSTPNALTDKTALVSVLPKFYGGFENSITFKGFKLDFLFQFVKQKGQSIFFSNSALVPGAFTRGGSNQPTTVLARWQNVGDETSIQRYSSRSKVESVLNKAVTSDAAYIDASYLRLKNLSVSWQLPKRLQKNISLENGRFYIQGQNLITITRYKGLDPENQGISWLPPLRVITMGLQIQF